jgi:hypothetical protein
MIDQNLLQYLIDKYQPYSIILHGSRLSGNASENSDVDLEIIAENPDDISPEIWQGIPLDVTGIAKTDDIFLAKGIPLFPTLLLYDTAEGFGQGMIDRTNAAYQAGPEPLSASEISSKMNFLSRMYYRLKTRQGEPLLLQRYYIAETYQRLIRYYFEVNQKWTQTIYLALPDIRNEAPTFHEILEKLHTEHYMQAIEEAYAFLFHENLETK